MNTTLYLSKVSRMLNPPRNMALLPAAYNRRRARMLAGDTNMREFMRAHYLQHVAFEGLGCIDGWLRTAGYEVGCTRLFAGERLPALEEIDLLVVMGGPMSVNDEADYPWLVEEKAFVRQAIAAEMPVLGICLGAQLMASAMGARVYPHAVKEIGWFPVQGVTLSGEGFRFPETVAVFHWHGETFDLPEGALHLARSEACVNQAFQIGRRAIGLQFHIETTPASAEAIATHCRDELVPAATVQSGETILAATPERYRQINRLMAELLAYLVG
jgi:GMP synthase-like glutamine amidotransferase